MILSWILLIFLAVVFGQLIVYAIRYGITPTPTSPKVKKKILQTFPKLAEGKIMELGSGWGSLAIPLAQSYPSCQVVAYEISPLPYLISKLAAKFLRCRNLTTIRQNFFEASFKDAAVVVCYLYPKAMARLRIKFEKELQPGAYVVSHTFAIPGWKPFKVEHASDLYHTPIYYYTYTPEAQADDLNASTGYKDSSSLSFRRGN